MLLVLNIHLLGNFHLSFGDELVTGVKTTRLQSLLAYLVLHRDAPQPRQRVAFLFWPDASEIQARNNLRNLLHFLRRALPSNGDYLLVNSQSIQWNPQALFILDVDQFIRAATESEEAESLRRAIELYPGDLIPDCYDDWVQPQREQLRELFIESLERMIKYLENNHDFPQAIMYARRLLRFEPLREEAHFCLMRLYSLNGDRAMALHAYHSFVPLLERELGVKPGADIQTAYERLLTGQEQPRIEQLPGNIPLIGRQHEWEILQSTWRNISPGQSRFLQVSGEAGIGKTRLVEEYVDWAERTGIATAKANCFSADGDLSYSPVASWLHSRPVPPLEDLWLSEVARLLPEVLIERPNLPTPEPITQDWQRLRLFKALGHAILIGRSEVILIIEDMQWCDRDTLEWIAYLLQAQPGIAPQTRLLVIGTSQSGEAIENMPLFTLLSDLRHADKITEIELAPLDLDGTLALAEAILGETIHPTWGTGLFFETEGNPLFVVETARAGKPGASFTFMDSRLSLPEKVRKVVEARLVRLSSAAQEVAGFAAVIGREFSYQILSRAGSWSEEYLILALDELWRKRLIRERGSGNYDFSHEKIRQVAYTRMSETRRRFCHHKVAQALEELYPNDPGPVAEQLAFHYYLTGILEKSVTHYYLAAKNARHIFANQQALQLLGRGLQLLTGSEASNLPVEWVAEEQSRFYELYGDITASIGQYGEACQNHQQALALVRKANLFGMARLQRKIGNDFREQVNYDQAVAAYQRSQELIGQPPLTDPEGWWWEWIELQLDHSLVNFYLSSEDEVLQIVERLKPVIEQYGNTPQRGRFYRRLVTIKFRQNRFAVDRETLDLSRKALATIKESGDLVEIASAHFGLGLALLCDESFDEAEEQIHVALEVAKQTGQNLLPVCFSYLAVIYRRRNYMETALDYARRALEITSPQKDPIYFAMAKSTFAWEAWRKRRLSEAEQLAQQALSIWQYLPDAFPFRWIALWLLIGLALDQDRLGEAFDYAQALSGPFQQLPSPTIATIVANAIQAWKANRSADARRTLIQAVELAKQAGYL